MSLEKISGKVANFYMVMLSLAEGVVEACPQAVLGLLKKNKTISDGGITVDFWFIKIHTSN